MLAAGKCLTNRHLRAPIQLEIYTVDLRVNLNPDVLY